MGFVKRNAEQAQHREHDAVVARVKSQRIIKAIAIQAYAEDWTEIETLLALGAACPFYTWPEKVIWLEEVNARFYV
jgi:hypothetical protein